MRRDEGGYIVVETLGAFIPFVLLLLFIVTLVNVVTLKAKVHYALTQTAQDISMLSYVGEAVEYERPHVIAAFQYFLTIMDSILPNVSMTPEEMEMLFKDEDSWQAEDIQMIFEHYLWRGDETIETQGLIGGVDAFDVSQSQLDFENGTVHLVVEYSIDYTFMGILRPSSALKIKQYAATKMWRNGNGQGYDFWKDGLHNINK